LRREERIAPDDPIRYERGSVESPEVLVISDPSFLPTVRGAGPAGGGLHGLRRRSVLSLLVPALVVLGALVLLYIWALPRLAERVAARVPVEWEESLGRTVVASITETRQSCTEPARVAALDRMVATLTADGRGGRYTYRVTIVDDAMVNALAAPGGHIVIFHGLLAQAGSPEELAGVLAHEIEHVVQQHGVTGILRQLPLQLAVSAIVGTDGFGASISQMALMVGGLSYRRADEAEADLEGLRMLAAARVSADGMLDFFRRSEASAADDSRFLNYISTHPNNAQRIALLESEAQAFSYTPQPVLTGQEWAALRARCAR
jgi:predicted Zn-dependent protease